ncbi:MAG: glutamine synthetase [Sphingomonas sp.]|nr:glutamine synthetase [Sphingomonas sp.]
MKPASPQLSFEDRLAACGPIERVELFVIDVNGVARGKWVPAAKAATILREGLPMPRSVFALDIWGSDVGAAGLAFGTGDPDGLCFPIASSIAPMPWASVPTAQMLLSMRGPDGEGYFADPRVILQKQVAELAARGFNAVTAVELEFYLVVDQPGVPRPVRATLPGEGLSPIEAGQVLAIDMLAEQEAFLNEVLATCRAQALPAEAVMRENSPGQFEINLGHGADACLAADQAVLFKRVVKAVARKYGMRASFMAKPFGELAGSGMHVHVSLLDTAGAPVFAGADGTPTPALLHAVGGLVTSMPDAMLLFAPHANSYRRFRRNSHAPISASWGWGDRSAAVRVIEGTSSAVRLEHRLAGADANPYLVLAAILAGIVDGLDGSIDPGTPQDAASTMPQGARLPLDWRSAIDRFEHSAFMAVRLGGDVRAMISACKWQDFDGLLARVPDTEYATYLGTV